MPRTCLIAREGIDKRRRVHGTAQTGPQTALVKRDAGRSLEVRVIERPRLVGDFISRLEITSGCLHYRTMPCNLKPSRISAIRVFMSLNVNEAPLAPHRGLSDPFSNQTSPATSTLRRRSGTQRALYEDGTRRDGSLNADGRGYAKRRSTKTSRYAEGLGERRWFDVRVGSLESLI